MISKEEMLNHIDKSMNTLKEDLKKYIDESVEENNKEKEREDYRRFKIKTNEFISHSELYNINPSKLEVGDIVFGLVFGNDMESCRYPFEIIYKDNKKLIIQGIKKPSNLYTFNQACNLKWDVYYMLNNKSYIKEGCTIISKEIIDEYDLEKPYNLCLGFPYWTSTPIASTGWRIDCIGEVGYNNIIEGLSKHAAFPCMIINL